MIKYQSAVLFVKDIAAARRFYTDLLDQKVRMDHGTNVGFEAGFALWQVDHARQVIHGQAESTPGSLGCDNLELYFESDALDATWERFASAGVTVVHPIVEQPWGQRVFRVADPDGYVVEVAEPMPVAIQRMLAQGLTVEEVAKQAAMPVEIIKLLAQPPVTP
jgi:catechol 2,3-dioxygenase-like lactoylglutathione lyase family enzyme